MRPRVLIVIPARHASTRFPGKPLALIAGVSLVQRVHALCSRVGRDARVIVATDDRRIERHVRGFGGEVMMTRRDHPSGTDRVAEVARRHACPIVINVQGDEPLLDPRVIRRLADAMRRDSSIRMATLCHPIFDRRDIADANVVKVVMNHRGNALYFSRAAIPHHRDGAGADQRAWRHIGIYAYRRDFLLRYVRWPQSALERMEKLEQLRALENGVSIRVMETSYSAIGVDRPGDVRKVERLLRGNRRRGRGDPAGSPTASPPTSLKR